MPLTHWLMNLPCVTLHDSCHSSNLAHSSASGERKRGARSIDVNYADVTREGAHRSVSPPKESIKVKQLVFSPLFSFSFRDSIMSLWRWTTHLHHQTNDQPQNITHLNPTTHLAINSLLKLSSTVESLYGCYFILFHYFGHPLQQTQ